MKLHHTIMKYRVQYSVVTTHPVWGTPTSNSQTTGLEMVVEAVTSGQAQAMVEAINPTYQVISATPIYD